MKNAINLLLYYFYSIYKKKDILEEKKKENVYSLFQISFESSHRWKLFQLMHISKVNFRITGVWSRPSDDKYSFVTWQFSNFNGIIINLFHALTTEIHVSFEWELLRY